MIGLWNSAIADLQKRLGFGGDTRTSLLSSHTRRQAARRWLIRFPRAVPLAIFLLIGTITFIAVVSVQRGEDGRAAAQLRVRASSIAAALERRANASSAYLRAGAALMASMEDAASAQRFRRFVSELRLDADYRGAEGIGWAQVVRRQDIPQFQQMLAMQTPGATGITPPLAYDQTFAIPVTFLQPDTERNRRALGFDMYSDPIRRVAMLEAERTARPTATDKVVLRQEQAGSSAPGFLIYMPVFEGTVGGRRLRGFIYSPFNAEDFLESALEMEDAGITSVRLYDGTAAPDRLLASSGPTDDEGEMVTELMSIANNSWVLQVSAAKERGLSVLSMVTIIFGLVIATMLVQLVRLLTKQALEDETRLQWFEEQSSIRMSLTRELNHRVKNTLANVLSIIALTRRRATQLNDFADGLDGRIRALSATHDLLTQSEWGTTPVRAVMEAELLPYADASDHEIDLAGPDVALAPNEALSLGLATHELATNAAKYGALSQAGGKVTLHWRLISESLIRIDWQESGGPPVPQQRNRGFGSDLIERIVAAELKNPVKLTFDPAGVRCMLTIPVRQPTEFAMRAARAMRSQARANG
ncbi:CHASE domain-containing protein [Croceibacterium ferulae]|uniref:CHASE domain-containing protein n=1 Tax=Croceibacterium ferulae TaxID=1854641 RepID=UPI000EB0C0AD|nr:CHASE domain-containing protein [Croceibacterium ferulae]